MTFSGVASNFAGIPLALAFTFTLGQLGLVTVLLKDLGIDIWGNGFTLYTQARPRDRLPLLPVPAHGADHGARHRRAAARVARGGREHGRDPAPVLAARGPADPHPDDPRQHDPAVRQRLRRPGHGLPADRRPDPARHRWSSATRSAATCSTTPGSGTPSRWAASGSWRSRSSPTASCSGAPSGGCDDRRRAAAIGATRARRARIDRLVQPPRPSGPAVATARRGRGSSSSSA